MLTNTLNRIGLRGWHMHTTSLATIYLCISLWIRAKTVDQEERGNAERRAVFVGLWPPMFWLIGDTLQDSQNARSPLEGPVPSAAMSVLPIAGTIPDNLADLIGNTLMVGSRGWRPTAAPSQLAKLEAYNPAGSVKDRIGVAMIEAAEAEGRIEPGRNTIVESTSGNTGIALAFVAAAKGYGSVVTLPQGMSREREKLLRLYGAQVVLVETMGGMNEAVEEARGASAASAATAGCRTSSPTRPTRTSTAAPPRRRSARLRRQVDVFVAGVGTGGTITGCGERLKEHNPDLHGGGGAEELAGALGRRPARTRSTGSAPASCPRCSTAR